MTSHVRLWRAAWLAIALGLPALAVSLLWITNVSAAGIVVTSAADGAPADDGLCTLREAILNANSDSTAGSIDCAAGSGADTITFAAGLDGQTISLATIGDTTNGPSALAITSTLALQGPPGSGLTIARDSAVANLRLFTVSSSGQLTIANLTLANGRAIGDTPAAPGSDGGAGLGGAIYSSDGAVALLDSTLIGNIAIGGDGAANPAGAGGRGGAGLGGAIYARGGVLRVSNSTFSDNTSAGGAGGTGGPADGSAGQGQGGGVYGRDGTLVVVNSTLSENGADQGGGIFSQSETLTASLALTNTIVANSLGATDLEVQAANGLTPATSGGGNLIESQVGYTAGIVSTGDPRLGALAGNGGPTRTYALLAGSPALDGGVGTGAPSADQRGNPRGAVDIGAYEAHPWLSDIPDQATDEDTPLLLSFDVGDLTLASGGLMVGVASSNPTLAPGGSILVGGSGTTRTLTITPTSNLAGTAVITVTVADGLASMQDSFTLTVQAVDDPPTASNDTYTTSEDTILNVTARGVLANDADVDGAALTAQLDSTAGHGSLVLGTDGSFSYTPGANYCGPDSFSYHADDGALASNSATVGIDVACVNDAPVADAGARTTNEDTPFSGTLSVSDIEGDALSYSIVSAPAKGTISIPITSTGVFTYTPNVDANGSDSFTFKVNDGSADSNVATVAVAITPVNDPPRFTAGAHQAVNEDAGAQTVAGWAQGISAGAADESGQALTFVVTGNSNPGLFAGAPAIAPDGTLTYTPAAEASGSATITLSLVDNGGTANGGADTSTTQTFSVTVNSVNDPPVNSVPGAQTLNEDTALSFGSANGNLISVSDIDAGAGTIYVTLGVTSGTLTLGGTAGLTFIFGDGVNDGIMTFTAGTSAANAALSGLTYRPLPNSNGPASLTITTNDLGNVGGGGAGNDSDTVAIMVNAVNDSPIASVPGPQTTSEDTPLIFSAANGNLISINDLDADGAPIRITLSVADGALSLARTSGLTFSSGDGVADMSMTFTGALDDIAAALNGLTYLPAPNDSGPTSVTIAANDLGNTGSGGALTDTDTIAVTVVAVDDAPTISSIADLQTGEDIPSGAIDFQIGDVETLSENLTVSATSSNTTLLPSANMTLGGVRSNRSITLAPAPDQNGATTITISVGDGANITTTSFALTVEPINDPPAIDPITDLSVAEDSGARTIGLSGIGAGPADESAQALSLIASSDNPALIASPTISYSSGSVTGALTFMPAADGNGTATITVRVRDDGGTNGGGSDSAQRSFIINVSAVNDPPTLNPIGDVSSLENAPAQSLLLSGISAGPLNERGQHLTVTATSDNLALLPNPSISYTDGAMTGTLSFTLAPDAIGSANISVRVADDGGTAGVGTNAITRTFTISAGAVNHRPTLDQPSDQTILEDAGTQTVSLSGIGTGSANEIGQTLTLTASSDHPELIANLSFSYANGSAVGTLTYDVLSNANGTAAITVRVQDSGGIANGAIDLVEKTFFVNITAVNDAPDFAPGPDQIANSRAGPQSVAGWARGFTPGPADEASQMLLGFIIVSISNPAIFAAPPAVDAAGRLTYTPVPGAEGSATIGVVVRDSGGAANGGVDTSAIQTFTIAVRPLYQVYVPRI